MRLDFAPMEGITDTIYRRTHFSMFSGVSKYFIPFVAPSQHLCFTPREKYALDPEENKGIPAVPQILAKDAHLFLWAAEEMKKRGYREVNLNLGCPAATVTSKGKGAGMLKELDPLRRFLDEIFEKAPLPISLKSRIGFADLNEWPALFSLFARYPFSEVIIHPRLREEFYEGLPHEEAFAASLSAFSCPVIYNGDICRPEDGERLMKLCPDTAGLMIGRGILSNPALPREMQGGEKLKLTEFRAFHDALYEAYLEKYGASVALLRMKALMQYMSCCFENVSKAKKALKKANSAPAYLQAAENLFSSCPLKDSPAFYWEK